MIIRVSRHHHHFVIDTPPDDPVVDTHSTNNPREHQNTTTITWETSTCSETGCSHFTQSKGKVLDKNTLALTPSRLRPKSQFVVITVRIVFTRLAHGQRKHSHSHPLSLQIRLWYKIWISIIDQKHNRCAESRCPWLGGPAQIKSDRETRSMIQQDPSPLVDSPINGEPIKGIHLTKPDAAEYTKRFNEGPSVPSPILSSPPFLSRKWHNQSSNKRVMAVRIQRNNKWAGKWRVNSQYELGGVFGEMHIDSRSRQCSTISIGKALGFESGTFHIHRINTSQMKHIDDWGIGGSLQQHRSSWSIADLDWSCLLFKSWIDGPDGGRLNLDIHHAVDTHTTS